MNITEHLIDSCPCPILTLDRQGRVTCSNRAWRELAAPENGLLGALKSELSLKTTEAVTCELQWGGTWFKVTKSGADPALHAAACLIVLTDITELKGRETRALRLALHDPLTKVFNRRAFYDYAKTLNGTSAALILIDLDHFKHVNDTYGHDVGDEVLKHVASRLQHALKESDVVARWGGDEFLILLPQTTEVEAETAKQRLSAVLNAPYVVNNARLTLSVSVGSIVTELSETNIEEALKQADMRMYKHKQTPRTSTSGTPDTLSRPPRPLGTPAHG